MRNGFTTGSCAAAATKAAVRMALSGNKIDNVRIITPAGIPYETVVEDICMCDGEVSCCVVKDSGDDPDVTNGIRIYSTITLIDDGGDNIVIDGGKGIGKVTRSGLDPKVGCAAINSVPLKMIEQAAREEMAVYDFNGTIKIMISAPEGEEIALKTFNSRLGIEGGISIIGTSGIVEAMSTKAIKDTIKLELSQNKTEGAEIALVSPGNYGLDFMRQEYDLDLGKAVKCSNYIGETIDMAVELGYKRMLLVGHIGKLIKVSGGIMNTHSKEADCRMELLAVAALKSGASRRTLECILDSLSTEEAYKFIMDDNIKEKVSEYIMEKISYYLNKRAGGEMTVECIIYSNELGLLGKTAKADEYINICR